MAKRITNGQREEVKRLYDKGLNPYKIARQTGISYSSVYGMTRIRQRVNPETGKPFSSLGELQDYSARQRVNPETGKPFSSKAEYEDYNTRQRVNPETGKPFSSKAEYEDYNARQRVNPETGKPFNSQTKYNDYNARQKVNPETGKSFSSLEDLRDYNARQRVNKNKELSDLVKSRLKKLGKNQSWLAEKLGVSRRIISFYCQGRSMPKKEKLDALLKILNLERAKPESLDNLVEE